MESFTAIASEFLDFIWAVLGQWATLSTGGLLVAVWALWERKNHRQVPWPVARKLIAALLFLAVFLAWKDQRNQFISARIALAKQEQNVLDKEAAARNQEAEVVNRDRQLNNRDTQLTDRDSQIARLQAKASEQQQTVSNLLAELQKAHQPEPGRITMFRYGFVAPNLAVAPNVTPIVLLNNKTMTPVRGTLICDNPIDGVKINIAGAGIVSSGSQRIAANSIQITVDSPAWTPYNPLALIVYHHAKDLGSCNFDLSGGRLAAPP
jgi:hypothetical protein